VAESRTRKICHCQSAADCPAIAGACQGAACLPSGYCGAGVTVGAACDDGDPCTTNDACQADGSCAGSPIVCQPLDQCHDAGTCDPATGQCSNPAKLDGSGCDDGDACTFSAACYGGVCIATSVTICTALDECHDAGTCDPATGACSNPAKLDGAPCSLGSCQNGVCQASGTGGACVTNEDCPPDACYPNRTCLNGVCDNGLVIKPFSWCNEVVCDPATGWSIGGPIACDSPGPCQTGPGTCQAEQGCVYPSLCAACQTCDNGQCVDNCPPNTTVPCKKETGACNTATGLCDYPSNCHSCHQCSLDPLNPVCVPSPNGTLYTLSSGQQATCCDGLETFPSDSCPLGLCSFPTSTGFCCGVAIDGACCEGVDVNGHCCPVGSVAYCSGNGLNECCDHECTCAGFGCFCG
jgi:hypothetical protein